MLPPSAKIGLELASKVSFFAKRRERELVDSVMLGSQDF
jgi:hypothetical protein